MPEVLFNRLGALSLPRKSVVRLTDHPDMTLDVYRGRKTTTHNHRRFDTVLNGSRRFSTVDHMGADVLGVEVLGVDIMALILLISALSSISWHS